MRYQRPFWSFVVTLMAILALHTSFFILLLSLLWPFSLYTPPFSSFCCHSYGHSRSTHLLFHPFVVTLMAILALHTSFFILLLSLLRPFSLYTPPFSSFCCHSYGHSRGTQRFYTPPFSAILVLHMCLAVSRMSTNKSGVCARRSRDHVIRISLTFGKASFTLLLIGPKQ